MSDALGRAMGENPVILFAGGRPSGPGDPGRQFAPALAGLERPRVAYVGTANGDSQPFYLMMKAGLTAAGAGEVVKVRLASERADVGRARRQLAEADVIFLSGGEVEDGMAWLVRHGLVGLLHELHAAGRRFVGVSAGTIMLGSHWVHWDVEGDDDTSSLFDCLGLSPLLFDVHGESEDWVELKAALRLLGDGAVGYGLPGGAAMRADGQGGLEPLSGGPLVFVNDGGAIRLEGAVSAVPAAGLGRPAGRPLKVAITCNIKGGQPAGGGPVAGRGDLAAAPPDNEAEFDEPATVEAIRAALAAAGHAVSVLEADADLPARLMADRPDIAFNIAEGRGGRGREAQVPAILSYYGIPHTGSDEATLCLTMDKSWAKRMLASHGLATPRWQVFSQADEPLDPALRFPLIVKPVAEGSSKGIPDLSLADDAETLAGLLHDRLRAYGQPMLAEEYIAGREFTVGLLGNGEDLRVFWPMEVIFTDPGHPIYSYEVKQDFRRYVRYACPPDLPAGQLEGLMQAAEAAYRALGCQDCARIDFRLSPADGLPYFIEANPLPGLAPGYSDFPMLAELNGVGYDELIQAILDAALARLGLSGPKEP